MVAEAPAVVGRADPALGGEPPTALRRKERGVAPPKVCMMLAALRSRRSPAERAGGVRWRSRRSVHSGVKSGSLHSGGVHRAPVSKLVGGSRRGLGWAEAARLASRPAVKMALLEPPTPSHTPRSTFLPRIAVVSMCTSLAHCGCGTRCPNGCTRPTCVTGREGGDGCSTAASMVFAVAGTPAGGSSAPMGGGEITAVDGAVRARVAGRGVRRSACTWRRD